MQLSVQWLYEDHTPQKKTTKKKKQKKKKHRDKRKPIHESLHIISCSYLDLKAESRQNRNLEIV